MKTRKTFDVRLNSGYFGFIFNGIRKFDFSNIGVHEMLGMEMMLKSLGFDPEKLKVMAEELSKAVEYHAARETAILMAIGEIARDLHDIKLKIDAIHAAVTIKGGIDGVVLQRDYEAGLITINYEAMDR